jgi:hypothetical protein
MSFWRRISPRRAVADFANEWRQPSPYRWQAMGVSIAATFAIMMVFLPANQRVAPRPPEITWITTYAPNRTDAEIAASNLANQRRKEELAAELAAREERRKELYRALGRATGVDVDAMEAQIAREQAGGEAAAPDATADAPPTVPPQAQQAAD